MKNTINTTTTTSTSVVEQFESFLTLAQNELEAIRKVAREYKASKSFERDIKWVLTCRSNDMIYGVYETAEGTASVKVVSGYFLDLYQFEYRSTAELNIKNIKASNGHGPLQFSVEPFGNVLKTLIDNAKANIAMWETTIENLKKMA